MSPTFSIKEALRFGWDVTKTHFFFLVSLFIVTIIAAAIPAWLAKIFQDSIIISWAFRALGWVLQILISIGLTHIALKLYDRETPVVADLWAQSKIFFTYLAGSVLYGLIVFVGLVLLIVPGIIWAIKYHFFGYLIIDRRLGAIAALKESGAITEGAKGRLFWYGVLFGLINALGVVCLVIGLFVSVPVTMLAAVFIYRELLKKVELAPALPVAPTISSASQTT